MIFTQLPPNHQLPPAGNGHYAPLRSSPLAPQTPRQTNNPDIDSPIHFSFSPRHDTPATPSFASPRGSNLVQLSQPNFTSPSPSCSSSRSKSSPTYAQRYASTISNPLANASKSRLYSPTSSSPSARDKRRDAFLNRIKAERNAGRLEDRSDQFMWLEHTAERKEWGQEMQRRAEKIMRGLELGGQEDEVDDQDEGMCFEEDYDSRALEEYLSTEEPLELDLMESNQDQGQDGMQTQTRSGDFGSFSDEEYDHLFLDLAGQSQGQGMDMSTG